MYDNLPLPWQISTPVEDFPQSLYVKHEFNRGGVVPEGEDFWGGSEERSLEDLEKALNTASMLTRWREANPEIAGTDQDVLNITIKDWKATLGDKKGMVMGAGTAILLFKKKS